MREVIFMEFKLLNYLFCIQLGISVLSRLVALICCVIAEMRLCGKSELFDECVINFNFATYGMRIYIFTFNRCIGLFF